MQRQPTQPDAHASAHPHHAELVNPDGSWKYTNALAKESSPYLLQHAHNPVDWHAWGPEAFELARKTNKPIFLSIGYSTCYWCHVMERQSFENPKIALLMNERFVCIKVDREERPDVDDIYMAAVQIVTGRGGWPMSVFLTPPGSGDGKDNFRGGLKPFYAGTYFPPEPAHGMPSFPQILLALSNAWNEQPKDVLSQADEVAAGVTKYLGQQDTSGPLNAAVVSTAANQFARGYDPDDGGFGGAPKFPQASNLLFLIAVHQNNPNDELWHALAHTLDRMARGGMYDQVGGGFHRYSTDEKWLVPHFEKMLYDNAQLVEVYLQAQRVRPKPDDADFYSRVARQTCDYVLREMTDSTGAFWSAQDAEVDAHEGQNYVWTADELKQAIGDDKLAELTLVLYGLDRGTNFRDPHDPAAAPINVLYLPEPLDEVARQRKIALADLLSDKAKIDAKLYAARMKRKQPGTDDKVLVSWNGMMIAALAQAGAQLNEPRYTAAAARAADAILSHLRAPDGGLYRSMRGGRVKEPAVNGFLDDYAFFIHGLIELHRATRDPKWLDAARALADLVPRKFGAPMGGYFDTLADQPDLFVRTRGTYDGAIPSGNSRMIHDLLDLSEVTRRPDPMEQGIEDLQSFGGSLKRQGQGMSHMQHALLRAIQIAPERFADATAATQPAATQVSGASPSSPPNRRQALSVSVDRTTIDVSGANNTLIVTLDIGDEYHINASEVKDKSLVPTRLELQGGKGLELQVEYPPGISKKFEFADEAISVYEGRVMLKTTIKKIGPVAKNAKPVLVLRYQACTERSCLQAKDVELPVIIKGAE